ncbi:hypothetical protein [Arthrobacter sp. NIO-1057]|uniref:hypothetical protein n=1 Tax=Arthrobacter sp. NIO-1057 TaxID=993071 RepID=UPI00071D139C|nr:hypothetical protein [Arthrobacter sp. NIO-1057]KSU64753.1 hypothetical protein AS038_15535 [Arthrobacter sp. NIO-1057]SCC50990.1 hypothetical protein GA0061084_3174 [Arthrobacter sp. NIO-1057]
MRAPKTPAGAVPAEVAARASQVAAGRDSLSVLVFTLSTHLPFFEIAEHLAEQFGELEVRAEISTAGPQRVQSVLDGKFKGIDVLVVIGETGADGEDQLMELVHWLLANGRQQLAENLIFAVVDDGRPAGNPVSFNYVVLPRSYLARTQRSGLRLPWAASARESWELVTAVLDYSLGLGAE